MSKARECLFTLAKNSAYAAPLLVAVIAYGQVSVKPYEPTPYSLLLAGLKIVHPASTGIVLGHQYQQPDYYKTPSRDLLKDTKPHVANVNIALEEANIPLDIKTASTIKRHDEAEPPYGSAEDLAHESLVIECFGEEYTNALKQGERLYKRVGGEGTTPEDFEKIRKEASFALAGVYAHTLFSLLKGLSHSLKTGGLSDKLARADKSLAKEIAVEAAQEELKRQDVTGLYKDRIETLRRDGLLKIEAGSTKVEVTFKFEDSLDAAADASKVDAGADVHDNTSPSRRNV